MAVSWQWRCNPKPISLVLEFPKLDFTEFLWDKSWGISGGSLAHIKPAPAIPIVTSVVRKET